MLGRPCQGTAHAPPRRGLLALSVLALSLLCAGGEPDDSPPSRPPAVPSKNQALLGECPAEPAGGLRYEVVIGACTQARSCPVQGHRTATGQQIALWRALHWSKFGCVQHRRPRNSRCCLVLPGQLSEAREVCSTYRVG
jgi:hypothetical protein